MRIATFNVQNLRARQDGSDWHFDGARDEIVALSKLSAADRATDRQDRLLTARLVADADADVLALQEVFNQETLDRFHDAHLAPLGARYPRRVCLPGNDGRRHLALLSRTPLTDVKSHAALTYGDIGVAAPSGEDAAGRIFRRDCLTALSSGVFLLVVHFKAPADEASLAVLRAEGQAVRKLIERRFADPANAAWLILGDVNVNDVAGADALDMLSDGFASDLAAGAPADARWTYFHAARSSYARPDRMLASPLLVRSCRRFEVWRQGMSLAAAAYEGPRLTSVGAVRPRASDHALLVADLDIPL